MCTDHCTSAQIKPVFRLSLQVYTIIQKYWNEMERMRGNIKGEQTIEINSDKTMKSSEISLYII